MATTRILKVGDSQAVSIPVELAYERIDIDFEIERVGDEIRIRPALQRLDQALTKFSQFSEDFMTDERELEQSQRDTF